MVSSEREDLGFTFRKLKNGDILIRHKGKIAATLRKNRALSFEEEIAMLSFSEQQQLMARVTGNYKHGNEKIARNHPRNRR